MICIFLLFFPALTFVEEYPPKFFQEASFSLKNCTVKLVQAGHICHNTPSEDLTVLTCVLHHWCFKHKDVRKSWKQDVYLYSVLIYFHIH